MLPHASADSAREHPRREAARRRPQPKHTMLCTSALESNDLTRNQEMDQLGLRVWRIGPLKIDDAACGTRKKSQSSIPAESALHVVAPAQGNGPIDEQSERGVRNTMQTPRRVVQVLKAPPPTDMAPAPPPQDVCAMHM
mmetsp:Transcript_115804/g.188696  ORF Transcript_115804/g.188696 Transcript_115804/m.188696 type:complete len:139 (+) Transcript_115804:18-434(+)